MPRLSTTAASCRSWGLQFQPCRNNSQIWKDQGRRGPHRVAPSRKLWRPHMHHHRHHHQCNPYTLCHRHMQHQTMAPCTHTQQHLQHYYQQQKETVDETTVGRRGANQGLDIKAHLWAVENHQWREAPWGKDELHPINKRSLTTGTSAKRVAGTRHSVTQTPRAPPITIAQTTHTRKDTPPWGIMTSH